MLAFRGFFSSGVVTLASVCLLALFMLPAHAQDKADYPRPKFLGDPATRGLNVQRTMTLLASSTAQHRNTVKILFYGQSITEQDWWKEVADDLRRRFPHANLIIENRALGGYSSQLLVKTAESDLYSFAPDLLIFHVYGSHDKYEDIIRRTRERTTAEVLIQTDHVTSDADLSEETDPAKLRPDGKIWNSFMNYLHLPTVAKKYGCALLNQRDLWKQYLKDNHLHATQLLRDGVHLNRFGNFVMAEFVKAYLVLRPDTHLDPMHCDTVQTFRADKNQVGKAGTVNVSFEGNRVDLVLPPQGQLPDPILLDGKPLSENPLLYHFTRALPTPGGKWPAILKIGHEKQPLLEDWTLKAKKDPANEKRYTFTLTGSKTGPDGEGSSDRRFLSNSGRVFIEPEDWGVEFALALPGIKPVPESFEVRWSVEPLYIEHLNPAESKDKSKDRTEENVITVAQGIENRRHTLTLQGPTAAGTEIRIYKPPVKTGIDTAAHASSDGSKRMIRILPLGDSITQGGRQGREEFSYRYPLYYLLRDSGYEVDFVGSLHTGLNAEFTWPARNGVPFDLDHEGHYGWKTAQVRDHLKEWMQSYSAPPDIALIHLGTNDQSEADYDRAIIQPLKEIIALLREKNPRVAVLLGHLNFNGGAALKIRPLVEEMAKSLNTAQSPVSTVAHYEGWHEKPDEPGSDTFDWAHPNPQGQAKMARRWFDAMKPVLDRMKTEQKAERAAQ